MQYYLYYVPQVSLPNITNFSQCSGLVSLMAHNAIINFQCMSLFLRNPTHCTRWLINQRPLPCAWQFRDPYLSLRKYGQVPRVPPQTSRVLPGARLQSGRCTAHEHFVRRAARRLTERSPSSIPAKPVNRLVYTGRLAPATPMTRPRLVMVSSLAPNTAAR